LRLIATFTLGKVQLCCALLGVGLSVVLMGLQSSESSSIKEILSFTEINWDSISKKSLVVFDVDGVLIMPADAILHPTDYNFDVEEKIRKTLDKSAHNSSALNLRELLNPRRFLPNDGQCRNKLDFQLVNEEISVDYWMKSTLFYRQQKNILIEPDILRILDLLKSKDIKSISLTNSITGSYATFPSFEKMRIDQLESLGVSFSSSFPHIPCCRLKKFRPNPMTAGLKRGRYPLFKRGILFTNKNPKGMVLEAFLKHLAWVPERIIFIDDRSSFLKDVQELCASKNIPFNGFLYRGMDSRLRKADEETARLQLVHFEKHLIWINDERAKRILQYTKPPCLYCKQTDPKSQGAGN
jgi:hypothetical protein